ncbi:MAG: flagellar basal-body rod protein FlgF [Deltaproteobacteria bacterium]|nr:flagellar basal-body rod protein FlgF [Deltaproteobacteria bacterium]
MNPQGIYTLVSRGNVLDRKMTAIANNLANVNTVGFKEDQPVFQQLFATVNGVAQESDEEMFAHHEHLAPYTGVGNFYVSVADMGKNFKLGRLSHTGNNLDFAIASKEGFFSVSTPQGERYTRAGNFRLNTEGQLITAEGFQVNGKDGKPLTITGNKVELLEDGTILVDSKQIGGLRLVSFPFNERLQKLGGSLFAPVDADNPPRVLEDVKMVQGMVEESNVDTVREMVRMIEANRSYTSTQKALRVSDEMNEKAVSLARV